MEHLHYLGVLIFIGVCAIGVALGFKVKTHHFWRKFFLSDLVILVIYLAWDYWAIRRRNWYFDHRQILNSLMIQRVPIEEILFFVVVPLTTIVTYKALIKLTGWGEARQ